MALQTHRGAPPCCYIRRAPAPFTAGQHGSLEHPLLAERCVRLVVSAAPTARLLAEPVPARAHPPLRRELRAPSTTPPCAPSRQASNTPGCRDTSRFHLRAPRPSASGDLVTRSAAFKRTGARGRNPAHPGCPAARLLRRMAKDGDWSPVSACPTGSWQAPDGRPSKTATNARKTRSPCFPRLDVPARRHTRGPCRARQHARARRAP